MLITTHSDYLIKEFNNLIMLSRSFTGKSEIAKKLKYREDDFLAPESVRAYVAEDNTLRRCEVDAFGIEMPVFDETIRPNQHCSKRISIAISRSQCEMTLERRLKEVLAQSVLESEKDDCIILRERQRIRE